MDKLEKEHVGIGVSGYKIDEVDGYDRYLWPDVATFPSGIPAEQMRQTYGLWMQRTTSKLYENIISVHSVWFVDPMREPVPFLM